MPQFITIKPQDAWQLMKEHPEISILDIRSQQEYEIEHIPRAKTLDYDGHQFQSKLEKLDKNQPYIIYCKSGVRGGYFMEKMRESGFLGAFNIQGGFVGWKSSKLPLVKD